MKVVFRGIKKAYGPDTVLDIPELEIESGAVTGIRGMNGSGKSTMLQIIAGIDRAYTGEILYDGIRPDDQMMKHVTCVFQRPQMLYTTVRGNIEYPLKMRKFSSRERNRKSSEMMERLGLTELASRGAKTLSGGEQQRVALARALVFEPELLLLDEASAHMDPDQRERFEDEIISYNARTGATVLMVTHSARQTAKMSKTVISLDEGRIMENAFF